MISSVARLWKIWTHNDEKHKTNVRHPSKKSGGRAHLSQQRHVLHDEGDVEERGEAVEEVELGEEGGEES